MKFKTTRKAIMNNYYNVLCVGYCDLQYLLQYKNPIAYTCGVYGWNSDIYQVSDNFAICTGYRPFGNIQSNYEYNRGIEKQAEKIVNSWNEYSFEEKQDKLNALIKQLIEYYRIKGA